MKPISTLQIKQVPLSYEERDNRFPIKYHYLEIQNEQE